MLSIVKYIFVKVRNWNLVKLIYPCDVSIRSSFEGMNRIGKHTHFDGYLAYGTYVGSNCDIAMVKIGKFCSIGPRVVVNPGRHPYTYPYATTCPMFYSIRKQNSGTYVNTQHYCEFDILDSGYAVEIGSDCWLGEGVFVSGGIKIGDGAVILAHAVVTKDVPPYAIVGGVPAKVIGYRYNDETINKLLVMKWWNKPLSWLKANCHKLRNIELLLD